MTDTATEERLARLEREVARLKRQSRKPNPPWWERIRGTFKDDPDYVDAMRLGREWRESEQLSNEETQPE